MTEKLGGVHFTIGSTPDAGASLTKDLNMIKAALLYADRAKLCSFTSSILLSAIEVSGFNSDQQLEFMQQVIPFAYADQPESSMVMEFIYQYQNLRKKSRLTRAENLKLLRIRADLRKMQVAVKEAIDKMTQEAGIDGLQQAIRTGLIELHPFNVLKFEDVANSYFDVVKDAVLDGNTYPLLDSQSSNLVRLGVAEGKLEVSESRSLNARHGAIVGSLMQRLPLFEHATIGEVLDVRKDLDQYLSRFRGAVAEFTDDIESAAWDSDFANDLNNLYLKSIAPAIADIEDAVKANSYVKQFSRTLTGKPFAGFSGSAIGLFVSNLTSLPGIISQSLAGLNLTAITPDSAAITAVGGVGFIAYDAYQEWSKANEATERNQLYFYYRSAKEFS